MQVNPSTMNIMDPSGHRFLTWDPNNPESVAKARAEFDHLRNVEHYAAYRMNDRSEDEVLSIEEDGELIRTFDPRAGRIMMSPPMQGG